MADLARATPLFGSRKSSELEDFLYVPTSVIVSPSTFASSILPAFQAATAQEGSVLKTFPVQELDVQVDRVTAALGPRPGARTRPSGSPTP